MREHRKKCVQNFDITIHLSDRDYYTWVPCPEDSSLEQRPQSNWSESTISLFSLPSRPRAPDSNLGQSANISLPPLMRESSLISDAISQLSILLNSVYYLPSPQMASEHIRSQIASAAADPVYYVETPAVHGNAAHAPQRIPPHSVPVPHVRPVPRIRNQGAPFVPAAFLGVHYLQNPIYRAQMELDRQMLTVPRVNYTQIPPIGIHRMYAPSPNFRPITLQTLHYQSQIPVLTHNSLPIPVLTPLRYQYPPSGMGPDAPPQTSSAAQPPQTMMVYDASTMSRGRAPNDMTLSQGFQATPRAPIILQADDSAAGSDFFDYSEIRERPCRLYTIYKPSLLANLQNSEDTTSAETFTNNMGLQNPECMIHENFGNEAAAFPQNYGLPPIPLQSHIYYGPNLPNIPNLEQTLVPPAGFYQNASNQNYGTSMPFANAPPAGFNNPPNPGINYGPMPPALGPPSNIQNMPINYGPNQPYGPQSNVQNFPNQAIKTGAIPRTNGPQSNVKNFPNQGIKTGAIPRTNQSKIQNLPNQALNYGPMLPVQGEILYHQNQGITYIPNACAPLSDVQNPPMNYSQMPPTHFQNHGITYGPPAFGPPTDIQKPRYGPSGGISSDMQNFQNQGLAHGPPNYGPMPSAYAPLPGFQNAPNQAINTGASTLGFQNFPNQAMKTGAIPRTNIHRNFPQPTETKGKSNPFTGPPPFLPAHFFTKTKNKKGTRGSDPEFIQVTLNNLMDIDYYRLYPDLFPTDYKDEPLPKLKPQAKTSKRNKSTDNKEFDNLRGEGMEADRQFLEGLIGQDAMSVQKEALALATNLMQNIGIVDSTGRKPLFQRGCSHCENSGEPPEVYYSHQLADRSGRVVCPKLRRHVCEKCGASGSDAHTGHNCPLNKK